MKAKSRKNVGWKISISDSFVEYEYELKIMDNSPVTIRSIETILRIVLQMGFIGRLGEGKIRGKK